MGRRSRSAASPTTTARWSPAPCSSACPGSRATATTSRPTRWRAARRRSSSRGRSTLGVPEVQVEDVRAAMAIAAARFYGDPTAAAARSGGHGHERQDHDRLPRPRAARGGRAPVRAARDRDLGGRGRGAADRAHHARGDRPPAHVPRDARRRRPRVRDGDLLARAGAAAGRRRPRRRGGVHQPHAGPPRLPSDDGGLLPGQAAAVRVAADATSGWSTSTTRTGAGWPTSSRTR